MSESKAIQTAKRFAEIDDQDTVFKGCVESNLTIAEIEDAMEEWKSIRARVEQRQVS